MMGKFAKLARRTCWKLVLIIAVLLLPPAATAGDDGWVTGDAGEAGFDGEAMAGLAKALAADEYSNLHAVVVEHDGKLVFEQYMAGEDNHWGYPVGRVNFHEDKLHDLRSISKSVVSLVLGIALGDDFAAALDEPVIKYFPDLTEPADVTLRHVLTMSAGLEWNEMTEPYTSNKNDEIRMYGADEPARHVLAKPQLHAPGKRWYYNGGLTMVLAGVVEEISGKSFVQYTNDVLFEPLGITEFRWYGPNKWRARGMPAAASGLRLRARDLAKIGSLVMHDGRWQGKQVVPSAWINLSTKRHRDDTAPWHNNGAYGYGFQWWHRSFNAGGDAFGAITGMGYGGQRLFIMPEEKIAVTIYSGNYGTTDWWKSERVLSQIMAAWKGK